MKRDEPNANLNINLKAVNLRFTVISILLSYQNNNIVINIK